MLYILFFCVSILVILLIVRCLYLMYNVYNGKRWKASIKVKGVTVKTAIVIGSGGHTAEMLQMTYFLDSHKYSPRVYIMADSDIVSENKIKEVERLYMFKTDFMIVKIPRSRNVLQSYITSIVTTLWSTLFCVPLILRQQPELILCNGPGTCIPICIVAFLLRALFLTRNCIVFVESVCRVKSLSLSGKILLLFADEILVQWPELQAKYKRTKYLGRL